MAELREWTSALRADLGLDVDPLACERLLAMARDVERHVARPAAPIAMYLVGMAVARGLSPYDAADTVSRHLDDWPRIDWRD